MNDVRQIAENRAAMPKKPPAGTSIQSDHQRQKKAIYQQVNAMNGSGIYKIAATEDPSKDDDTRILRTAAYCRVSTDDINQKLSIAMQVKHYGDMIRKNPKWKYMGTYVDDGYSGTNTSHREGFLRLMRDCMDGKIDMIITKAVSRFARNLLDCMTWVEKLQQLDPPVRVYFEQENLDTLAQTSGIILIVLAMVAEEESHMKSEAILLSLEWRFSRGRFLTPKLYGFDLVEMPDSFGGKRKVLRPNPQEAKVIEWMFNKLLSGATPEEIADVLTELGIPTGGYRKDGSVNTHWTSSTVSSHLRNERYCGDILGRKTYTKSYKDHKSYKNKRNKNKYFQSNHHEAIVSRTVWNAAQRILNSRRYGHEGVYLPMRVIDHGSLTGFISMNRSWAGFDVEDYFRVSQIAMGILEGELEADLGSEFIPDGGQKLKGLIDDHGITQIVRDLTKEEEEFRQEMDELANTPDSKKGDALRHVKIFQLASGDLFSSVHEPVFRITKSSIAFSAACVSKMSDTDYIELLFNPVVRFIIVRPCKKNNPNAIKWDAKPKGATALSKIFYAVMDWDSDYSFRVRCQPIPGPNGETVLAFDLDNYIGRAIAKKEEVIIARKEAEIQEGFSQNSRSCYYPPDENDEVIDLTKNEEDTIPSEQFYGEPAFMYSASHKIKTDGKWDFMAPTRELDSSHISDPEYLQALLSSIQEDPPEGPQPRQALDLVIDSQNTDSGDPDDSAETALNQAQETV